MLIFGSYSEINRSEVPYRTKLSKFRLGVENFVDEKFCPSKILSNILIQKSGKNQTKLSKFRLGVENFSDEIFCLTKYFVRRNFVL